MDKKCRCLRCGHKWVSRITRIPKRCPGCKSQYWNKPYSRRAKTIAARINSRSRS